MGIDIKLTLENNDVIVEWKHKGHLHKEFCKYYSDLCGTEYDGEPFPLDEEGIMHLMSVVIAAPFQKCLGRTVYKSETAWHSKLADLIALTGALEIVYKKPVFVYYSATE